MIGVILKLNEIIQVVANYPIEIRCHFPISLYVFNYWLYGRSYR